MSEELEEKYHTVADLAKMLSVKPHTVRRWIHDEEVKAVKLPGPRGDFRIPHSEAVRLVNNTFGSAK